jgi:Transposase, Mutator family
MPIKPKHLDELLSGYEKPEDLLGEDGLFKQMKKALLEPALGAELTQHLGYEKGDLARRGSDDHRNGSYPKTVLTEDGVVDLDVPRAATTPSRRRSCPRGKPGSPASTTRSSRCTTPGHGVARPFRVFRHTSNYARR